MHLKRTSGGLLQSAVVDHEAGESGYALQYAWDRMMRAAHDACSGQRISFIPHSFLLQISAISEALKAAVEALSTSSEAISALVLPSNLRSSFPRGYHSSFVAVIVLWGRCASLCARPFVEVWVS